MRGGGAHDDRDLASGDPADPVPKNRPFDPILSTDGPVELPHELQGRSLVRLVVEGDDPRATHGFPPDAPGEQHDPAEAGTRELTGGGGVRQPAATQPERHAHPPP
ncbi:MAG: hypothetical protein WA691_09120 [Thermoplasmata archaeon]